MPKTAKLSPKSPPATTGKIIKNRNPNYQGKVLLRVADLINTTTNSTTLLRRIVRETVDALEAQGGFIAFCADDDRTLRVDAIYEYKDTSLDANPMLPEDHCGAMALDETAAIRCNGAGKPGYYELACSLRVEGASLGVLVIRGAKGQEFSEEDERLLTAIAGQSARIIQTSRHFDGMAQHARRLEGLFDVGQQLVGSDALPEVLNRITEALLNIVDVKQCTVMLVGKGHDLQLSASSGGAGHYAQRRENMESLVEKLSARGEPVKVLDVKKMEGRRPGKQPKADRLTTLLAVPIFYHQQLVGILNVYTAKPRNFEDEEMSLLKAYASLCGIAIENARRHERLLSAADEIRVAERANTIHALSAAISIEVRNSLTASQLILDALLEDGAFPAGGSGDYEALTQNIGHINRIVSRVEAIGGRRMPQLEWLDMNAQVELVLALCQHRLTSRQILVNRRLTADLPRVLADKGAIQQAILQCITNAMESMRHGGILNLATSLIAGPDDQGGMPMVRINVRDTGHGLDANVTEDLFNPLGRSADSRVGIGLFVAWKVAQKYGGRLTARNATDHGASVSLTLPALEQEN